MSDKLIDDICSTLSSIGLPLCTVELASWAVANGIDSAAMENLYSLLRFADDKRASDKAEDLRRKSRLPDDYTRTFDSFNVDRLLEKDQKHFECIEVFGIHSCQKRCIDTRGRQDRQEPHSSGNWQ